MHVTELTESQINELKEYLEINELGYIITKKKNNRKSNTMRNGFSGDSKTKIGKRRGGKTKYGYNVSFKFPSDGNKVICKAREIVWVFSNGIYNPKMTVKPKNGDIFDDRIENLQLVKNSNGRPVGAKDKSKREKRDTLSGKQEREIIKLRKEGLTENQIAKNMETTCSVVKLALKRARKLNRLKSFFNTNTFAGKITEGGCQIGVYVLYASSLDSKNYISKGYIGSSRDTWKRLQSHFNNLNKGKHYNKEMQDAYDSGKYKFNAFWIERGDFEHGLELKLETEHINRYEKVSLFNKWSQPSFEEIQPYLDKYKHYLDDESRYTVDENGCWNWNQIKPDGYSKEIACYLGGKTKHIRPHRLSYYNTYGEYPELVRHMCDNRACVNPECLKKGSHQQNGLDRSREFRKEFEYWWLRYDGDVNKLTERFGFKANCNTGSISIYEWEKKLGLREKYKDVYYARNGFLSPEEKQKQEEEKEIRRNAKTKRKIEFEHSLKYKKRAVNLKRRFGGSAREISEYLNLPYGDVCKMVKDAEEPWRTLWGCEWFHNTKPYDDIDVKHIENLQKLHPEYAKDIEDNYAWHMFPVEAGLFTAFRRANQDRKRKKILIKST